MNIDWQTNLRHLYVQIALIIYQAHFKKLAATLDTEKASTSSTSVWRW